MSRKPLMVDSIFDLPLLAEDTRVPWLLRLRWAIAAFCRATFGCRWIAYSLWPDVSDSPTGEREQWSWREVYDVTCADAEYEWRKR